MNKFDGDSFSTPAPSKYVQSALRYIGYARHTTGYWPHSVMLIFGKLIAFIAPSFVTALVKKFVITARDKAIKEGSYTPAN